MTQARAGWLACCGALALSACRGAIARDASAERQAPDTASLIAEVTAVRGLPDARPTRIVFDDDAGFARALDEKRKSDAIGPTAADQPQFQLAFQLPSPSAQRGASPEEVIREQVIAFYDEHTHAIHVRKSSLADQTPDGISAVLAHELTHSLQVQHFSLPKLGSIDDEDSRLALDAVLEGDAMLSMVAYAATRGRIPVTRALVRAAAVLGQEEFDRWAKRSGAHRALMSAPPLQRERLTFPYVAGMGFVGALYRAGGFALVNRVYAAPPTTTEQILHAERYLAGEGAIPVRVPEAPPGYRTVLAGRVGELQLRVLLTQCLPRERAEAAAEGWGGDAFAIAVDAHGAGLLSWSTVWDDEDEAVEAEKALGEYRACTRAESGNRVLPGGDAIVRRGARIAMVRGVDDEALHALTAALLELPEARPSAVPPLGSVTIPPVRRARAVSPVYVRSGWYVNDELGLVAAVPPDRLHAELAGRWAASFSHEAPSPVVFGLLLSDQVSSSSTVDELQGALAESVQSHLGNLELEYTGGRQVRLRGLGWGLERTWHVAGTEAGLRSIAVPACNATGNLVVWQLWTDGEGRDLADWWLGTLRTRGDADPPVCAELNP